MSLLQIALAALLVGRYDVSGDVLHTYPQISPPLVSHDVRDYDIDLSNVDKIVSQLF